MPRENYKFCKLTPQRAEGNVLARMSGKNLITRSILSEKLEKELYAGEYFATKRPVILSTILGSCVAVSFYDHQVQAGGMNHILLPGWAQDPDKNGASRYAGNAIELLIQMMVNLGSRIGSMTARVYGGADMYNVGAQGQTVGSKNVESVLNLLAEEGIPVTEMDVGGRISRRVIFHADTGEIQLKIGPSFYDRRGNE